MKIPFIHSTAQKFVAAYAQAGENEYTHNSHYYRGGSQLLAKLERRTSKLIGAPDSFVSLTTSGMSAFITALETANLTAGDHIVHGTIEYGQIAEYFATDLPRRDVVDVAVDFGYIRAVEKTLQQLVKAKKSIKVLFVETVGNGPLMPVLDLERLLSLPILKEINPLVIVDNSLPTDSVIHLGNLMKDSPLRIIGLESATKFYLLNQDLGGILFTYKQDLYQQLLTKRKRIGSTPGPSLINVFDQLLPQSKKQFDKRNAVIMRNTKLLAEASFDAQKESNFVSIFYPNLLLHTNYEYTKQHFPKGIAPVFFISASPDAPFTTEELFYLLEKKGAFADILITESFGFDQTAVMYASRLGGYIRFAGGTESGQAIEQLKKQLQTALQKL
jgi:cystathionine beta-lyase/cystathionine gamma-synthase